MKRIVVAIGITGIAVLLGTVLLRGQEGPAAESKKEKRVINSSGIGTVIVKVDSARVFFAVQTLGPTIKQARSENAAKVKKVMDALEQLKVPDLKMKSSDMQVELITTQKEDHRKLPDILGFAVTHSFTVLAFNEDSQKLSKSAAQILDSALENGATMVEQIVFFKKDMAAAKQQALAEAVEDAEANAKAMAAGAKVRIAETTAITYDQAQYTMGNKIQIFQRPLGPPEGTETPLVAGEVEMTCQVSVTCSY
jgi:uncharacterized protein YggE